MSPPALPTSLSAPVISAPAPAPSTTLPSPASGLQGQIEDVSALPQGPNTGSESVEDESLSTAGPDEPLSEQQVQDTMEGPPNRQQRPPPSSLTRHDRCTRSRTPRSSPTSTQYSSPDPTVYQYQRFTPVNGPNASPPQQSPQSPAHQSPQFTSFDVRIASSAQGTPDRIGTYTPAMVQRRMGDGTTRLQQGYDYAEGLDTGSADRGTRWNGLMVARPGNFPEMVHTLLNCVQAGLNSDGSRQGH